MVDEFSVPVAHTSDASEIAQFILSEDRLQEPSRNEDGSFCDRECITLHKSEASIEVSGVELASYVFAAR